MGHSAHSSLDGRSHLSNATQDAANELHPLPTSSPMANPESTEAALREALKEVERRDARIQKLEAETMWYRSWADTYWQQLQHMSAAVGALNQQHIFALNNQQQQLAALAQYQMHMQAAAQVAKTAAGTTPVHAAPGLSGTGVGECHPIAESPFVTSRLQALAAATASDVSGT